MNRGKAKSATSEVLLVVDDVVQVVRSGVAAGLAERLPYSTCPSPAERDKEKFSYCVAETDKPAIYMYIICVSFGGQPELIIN